MAGGVTGQNGDHVQSRAEPEREVASGIATILIRNMVADFVMVTWLNGAHVLHLVQVKFLLFRCMLNVWTKEDNSDFKKID